MICQFQKVRKCVKRDIFLTADLRTCESIGKQTKNRKNAVLSSFAQHVVPVRHS